MSEMSTALDAVKLALQITEDDFDDELTRLMNASMLDIGLAGVIGENAVISNPLVLQAVITYCRMNFGHPDRYDDLKKAYDEYKAQMGMATGYTIWSVDDNG